MDSSHQKAVIESSLKLDSSEMTLNPLIQPLLVGTWSPSLPCGAWFFGFQKNGTGHGQANPNPSESQRGLQPGGVEESHPVDLEDQLPRNLDMSAWLRTHG